MPKRETKNYTPEVADVEGLIRDPFTYHCLHCSELAVILTEALETLPRRRTDGAFVVVPPSRGGGRTVHRNGLVEGDCRLLKREAGVERQYRWLCRGCRLVLAYRCSPFGDAAVDTLYLKTGALTRNASLNLVALGDRRAAVPGSIASTTLGVRMVVHLAIGAPVPIAVVDILNTAVLLQVKSSIKKEILHQLVERFLASLLGVPDTHVGVAALREADRVPEAGEPIPNPTLDDLALGRPLERVVTVRADLSPRLVLDRLLQSWTNTGRLLPPVATPSDPPPPVGPPPPAGPRA